MFSDAKDREDELRKIAEERGLSATESIEAEREAQKKARREIEALEAKKRQLENKLFYGSNYFDGNFICTKENGQPVTPNSIKYNVEKVRKLTGVDFNFHSFRHTHATMLLENNAKPKEIQTRLGHSRIATTMDTYAHVTKKMKKDTVDIFEQMLKNNSF